VRAGEAAFAVAATEEAITHYEFALGVLSGRAGAETELCDGLVKLGTALRWCGRTVEANERFSEAMSLAIAIGDSRLRAEAALGFGATMRFGPAEPSRLE